MTIFFPHIISVPAPLADELPAAYADRLGQWYLTWTRPDKSLGQVFTPLPVARFMASQLPLGQPIRRILDPGAGLGILACAVCEHFDTDLEIEAFEVDDQLADYLEVTLAYAQHWMQTQGRSLTYKVIRSDFLLSQSAASQRGLCLTTVQRGAIWLMRDEKLRLRF